MSPNYVPGVGALNAKLMLVGEAPGSHENVTQLPFQGPSGKVVDDCLSKAGVHRSECYITNVSKYQPPFNDFKKLNLIGVDLNASIESLWRDEINVIKPNCILCIGNEAFEAVTGSTGILNYRGSILHARDGATKVVPTIHPAALFSRGDVGGLDYNYLKLIEFDFIRAVEESNTSKLELPERHLVVAKNALDVYHFFREYENLTRATIDIESINCVPVCIGFSFNRHHAISIPLLKKIGRNDLTQMGENDLDECWDIIDKQLRRIDCIGHNLKYDEFKLNLIGFRLKKVISDTLIKTRVIWPELPDKKLSTVSSLWTREPYYKDEGKEFKLGKQNIEQLFKYNAKDCAVEFEVDEEQENDLLEIQNRYCVPAVSYYYDYMMKKHPFYLKMENNGFRVDVKRQRELFKKYTAMEKPVHDRITELVGHEVNVKSPPQVFELLYKEMRFKVRKEAPTSEDSIVALLGNYAKKENQREILEAILEERRIRDQKSRYINFVRDFDGRCKTSFNISATETCRSSTSILNKPVRPQKLGLAFHTISKHGRLAKDIRSMFIPDEGKIFLQADSSQAEARVVAVLSQDWDLLEAFDKIDIHRRTAGLIFGYTNKLILRDEKIPVVDILEKDGPERFTGKKVRHAGNYNMGKHRFMVEFNTDAQKFEINTSISEWRAGKMLDAFHEASPKIRNVFHLEIQDALKSTRILIDSFGGVRQFNGRMDEELFKEGYANIPQRTVAHLVQGAALKIDDELGDDVVHVSMNQLMLDRNIKGCNWLSENHDSLLMQVPENNWELYARLMKKHMMAPIDFSKYCTLKRNYVLTIPCDVEISDTNYSEMRKVKV